MLWLPSGGDIRVISNIGIVGNAVMGTNVPAHATVANSDGTVTELISAANNTQDSWGFEIAITGTGVSGSASESCLDLLIGGATDDVLINALICGYCRSEANTACVRRFFFPVHVPGGVRVAARLASVRTGFDAQVGIWLYSSGTPPFRVGRKVTTYGTQINGARGQDITPGTNGGAATATELSASSSEDHFAFMPGFQTETDASAGQRALNIGIGVGASTEQRIGTWYYQTDSGENMQGPNPTMPAFVNVPAGTRLTMLASNSGTNETYGGLIYAVS